MGILDDLIPIGIIIMICGGFIFAVFGFGSTFHISLDPGSGEQIGYISEVEAGGIIWRPDQITLIGSEATFSSSQTSWSYASASPEITDQARHYLKTHEKVIVRYETSLVAFGWEYSEASKITNITKAVV